VSQSEDRQQRQVFYEGRVQGVGFRYTVCRVAGRFGVTGYVRNLPDGRVLLVAEGAAEELDRFVAAVGAAMERYIRGVQETTGPATGQFADFGVRY
jgi:acylphosphatase